MAQTKGVAGGDSTTGRTRVVEHGGKGGGGGGGWVGEAGNEEKIDRDRYVILLN